MEHTKEYSFCILKFFFVWIHSILHIIHSNLQIIIVVYIYVYRIVVSLLNRFMNYFLAVLRFSPVRRKTGPIIGPSPAGIRFFFNFRAYAKPLATQHIPQNATFSICSVNSEANTTCRSTNKFFLAQKASYYNYATGSLLWERGVKCTTSSTLVVPMYWGNIYAEAVEATVARGRGTNNWLSVRRTTHFWWDAKNMWPWRNQKHTTL